MFPCEISKILRATILKNIGGRLLIKWYVIKHVRKNKSGVSHLNQIWFKCENNRLEKVRFQLALIRLSAPSHHSSSTEDSSIAKEQKLTKQCFLPPHHRFSTHSSQYQYWKARKYYILMVIELGPPVSESSTRSKQFIPPLILNINFIKRESKICYP